MSEKIPDKTELAALLGARLYDVWIKLCAMIEETYDMDRFWNKGGKAWAYEYKYRRGGKTLCTLYVKKGGIGFMVIFGKEERDTFEARRPDFSEAIQKTYDEAKTYRDGKWVMFEPGDCSMLGEFMKVLQIKRKPNRKQADSAIRTPMGGTTGRSGDLV